MALVKDHAQWRMDREAMVHANGAYMYLGTAIRLRSPWRGYSSILYEVWVFDFVLKYHISRLERFLIGRQEVAQVDPIPVPLPVAKHEPYEWMN